MKIKYSTITPYVQAELSAITGCNLRLDFPLIDGEVKLSFDFGFGLTLEGRTIT